MTIDEFVVALREAMPEMRKRGWKPTMKYGMMLRFAMPSGPCRCPLEALVLLRNQPLEYFTVDNGPTLGLTKRAAMRVINAADYGQPPTQGLRSRLIGAYQDYCRTLKGV